MSIRCSGDLEGEARACEFEEERSEDPNSTTAAKSATRVPLAVLESIGRRAAPPRVVVNILSWPLSARGLDAAIRNEPH